jgi:hypothetical protein
VLHPRLTPVGATIGGTSSTWLPLYQVGPYGAWSDLQINVRWGDGAAGMYEAQWTMPLPPDYDHPLLRRGTAVELMAGPYRVGSPLILAEPNRGTGLDEPWQFTATGIGRDVEGDNSFYAFDGSGNTTTVPTTAVDQAIADGWRIAGRDGSVTSTSPTSLATSDGLNSVGALMTAAAQAAGKRWGVKNDNLLYFMSDPTTPSYQVTPGTAALGVADDDYASTVKVRYLDSTTGQYLTRTATNAQTAATFGVRQFPVDITDRGAMSSTAAQNIADQILRCPRDGSGGPTADRHQQRAADDGRRTRRPVEGARGRRKRVHGAAARDLERPARLQRADVDRHHHR